MIKMELKIQDAELLDTENPYLEKRHLENRYAYKELNNQESKNKILCDKESTNQSASAQETDSVETVENMIDGVIEGYSTDTKRIKSIIKEHIEYEDYLQWIRLFGKDMTTAEIKQLVDKLAKAATSGKGRVINDESFSKYEVQEAVLNLNRECIEMGYQGRRSCILPLMKNITITAKRISRMIPMIFNVL